MYLLLLLFFFLGKLKADEQCTCTRKGLTPCSGGMYVDYYYNEPYVGSPRDSQYLPPEETVPEIIQRVTHIRDTIGEFLNTFDQQGENAKKALWMRQNFDQVRHLLRAVDKAANSTSLQQ